MDAQGESRVGLAPRGYPAARAREATEAPVSTYLDEIGTDRGFALKQKSGAVEVAHL